VRYDALDGQTGRDASTEQWHDQEEDTVDLSRLDSVFDAALRHINTAESVRFST
jgi:riboflavin biosynthesis pyrimidine reductase